MGRTGNRVFINPYLWGKVAGNKIKLITATSGSDNQALKWKAR